MENNEGDNGEHSGKSNGDGGERPFKKARYVWQLKGKYHLKDSQKQASNSDDKEGTTSKDPDESAGGGGDETILNAADNNNGESQDNNCNKCCLDTLLARSNALCETEDPSEPETGNKSPPSSEEEEVPMSLVGPETVGLLHDDFLNKWQARQVARSFVDNTINSILEQWKLAPIELADFVENCDNGGQVEDEGILMAIQSHGLHPGIPRARFPNIPRSNDGESSDAHANSTYSLAHAAYLEESAQDNFQNVHKELMKRKSLAELNKPRRSDVDKPIYEDNPSLEVGDPMDFLSAAVSVAIKKKGLSSYNYG